MVSGEEVTCAYDYTYGNCQEALELTVSGSYIAVRHTEFTEDLCPADIDVLAVEEGSAIYTAYTLANNTCDYNCCVNTSYTIAATPGTWTVHAGTMRGVVALP